MRKNFIYFVLIPFIIICVVVYFFIDGWVESGLEAAGDEIVGAKVEIDNLSINFSPIGVTWQRMQVTNPNDTWRNMFETGKVNFAMNFGQLLRGKYIIETMEVNELILDTKRTADGFIPGAKKEKSSGGTFAALAEEALAKTVEQTPVFNIDNLRKGINVDSLVKALDPQTLKHIDSLRRVVAEASGQWQASLADFETSKQRLAEIETSIKAINPSELKSIDKITSAISTVDNSIKTVNEINKTFNDRKTSITSDVQRVSGAVGSIDDVVKRDFQKLMEMARLPNLNTEGLAHLLVGQELYKRAMTYLSWVDFARDNIKKYSPEPEYEKPPRMKGQDINFPVGQAYPKLWIKNILVSGGTAKPENTEYVYLKGLVKNITNDQTVTGVPLTADLEAAEGGGRQLTLGALIDRTKDEPFDEFRARLAGVPLAEFTLGNADFLQGTINDAKLTSDVKITVPGNRFDATATFDLNNIKLTFAGDAKNTIERLVREVLQGVSGFDASLRLWNTGGPFDVAFRTNLAAQIAGRVQAVLGAEFAKLQNELRAKFDKEIAAKRQEFEKFYAAKKQEIDSQLNAYQSLVTDKLAMVEAKKKELTDQQKKGGLDNLLKGIGK